MSGDRNARIVLIGLDESLSSELCTVLRSECDSVHVQPFSTAHECLRAVDQLGADLVFCSSERERYAELLEAVTRHKPDLPVVVVSPAPEVSEWLDAIEAGASDYCAAPFETSHIQWILDSTLKRQAETPLYRTAG